MMTPQLFSTNRPTLPVNYRLGELERTERFFVKAVEIHECLAAEAGLALDYGMLAWVAIRRGDLNAAAQSSQRGLEIAQTSLPASRAHADSLYTAGFVKLERGDLAAAEGLFREGMRLQRNLRRSVVSEVNGLGLVAERRGDFLSAHHYFRQALEESEREGLPLGDVALFLNNLGWVALRLGDLSQAESWLERGLKLAEGQDAQVEGYLRAVLGTLARERKDFDTAHEQALRALQIFEKTTPGSVDYARSLIDLGRIANERGRGNDAERYFSEVLTVLSKLRAASYYEAKAQHGLGRARWVAGQRAEGMEMLCRAVDALGEQSQRLGGAQEARSAFSAEYADYYRDCLAARVHMGLLEEALDILERSRANTFLRMLAERDVLIATDLPSELSSERIRLNAEYERTQAILGELKPERDSVEIERLVARHQELRDQREDVVARIRSSAPRLASLQYPQPLAKLRLKPTSSG
jgi:tetratricopeptide (TPR) repeat protein